MLILDIQGFRDDQGGFIFKELAALSLSDVVCYSFLFKPPENSTVSSKSALNKNRWLTNNYHGLTYECGYTPYTEVQNIIHDLTANVEAVYVKGIEKRAEILKICPDINVLNIEEEEGSLGIPSIKDLRRHFCAKACLWHTDVDSVCAVRNILNIYLWHHHGQSRGSPVSGGNDEECKLSLWCLCK